MLAQEGEKILSEFYLTDKTCVLYCFWDGCPVPILNVNSEGVLRLKIRVGELLFDNFIGGVFRRLTRRKTVKHRKQVWRLGSRAPSRRQGVAILEPWNKFVVKLERAYGGYLGIERRRRTL